MPAVMEASLSQFRYTLHRLTDRQVLLLRVGIAVVLLLGVGAPLAGAYKVWPFVVAGVADGSVYGLAALGLVLTYKTSGMFNLAIGAQAAASAYVFYSLRIVVGLPWPIAAVLCLIGVGLGGALIFERLALWLSDAAPVFRVVTTIGLMVFLQSLLSAAYGPATLTMPAFLPTSIVRIGGVNVSVGQIIIVALGILATATLYLFFRRTRLGVSMQAVVEDPSLLALQATNPDVVRRYAWSIGSCFVSVSGMLVAPAFGVDVNHMLLVFIAAFGAAALASFTSLAGAFTAALAIGIAVNVVSYELSSSANVVVNSFYTQIPFLVLVLALGLLPKRRLAERGAARVRRFKPVRTFPRELVITTSVIAIAAAVAIPYVVTSADIDQYTEAAGFFIILASMGLLLWTSGQISLCHMAFAAVGAVTLGHAEAAGLPWLLGVALAALVALPVGALVAIPSFRLSGTFLAVITFGVGLLFQNLLYTTFLMFGSLGSIDVGRPHVKLFGLDLNGDRGYYFVALVAAAGAALVVVMVRRSRLGRFSRALSDSPQALEAHGTDTRLTRPFVFCISAAMAAVGGAMVAGVTGSASSYQAGSFGYFTSLVIVAVLVFCGRLPLLSPLVAAVVLEVLKIYPPFDRTGYINYQGVIFGVLAIGAAVLPGIKISHLGRRAAQRTDPGRLSARLEFAMDGVAG
ncbi:MAG TPA: ABC transporter permease [Jatrophihabitantaceae bacterium]